MNTSALALSDLTRVCRDLAWSEISAMPALAARLGARCSTSAAIDWSDSSLALDSLARMQLATAAATWCNAFDSGFEDLFLAKRNAGDWAVAMRRVAELGGPHLTFSSSGSTGVCKHIRHQLTVLMGEAQAWASLLCNDQTQCPPDFEIRGVVVLAPTHHIYGFIWGVLLPIALKVPAVDADLQTLPRLLAGDLVVAVPDQWTWLANAHYLTESWPSAIKGVSSTAPLAAKTHRALTSKVTRQGMMEKPPLAQLLHIYGSAETAGLAWRDASEQSYTLAAGRLRTANDGIALLQANGDQPALQSQIENWAADNLPWYANPGVFTYGLSPPRSSMGKLCGWPD